MIDASGIVVTGASGKRMSLSQVVDVITSGRQIVTKNFFGSSISLNFLEFGDSAFRLLPNEDFSISVSGGVSGQIQIMRLLIQQPYNGNCEITWPNNITWTNSPIFVDTRIGVVSCIDILWDGMSNYYGSMIFG